MTSRRLSAVKQVARRAPAAAAFALLLLFTAIAAAESPSYPAIEPDYDYETIQPPGTFSIVALDPETGQLAVGVQSNTIAVGSRTRWGMGGVAAIASQASSNPMFGEIGVLLLQRGFSPQEAMEMMVRMDNGALNRQFAIIDIHGRTAAWTSPEITDWKGHLCGENYCAQGNTLTGPEVILAMAEAFENTEGPLAERVLAALEAGEAAGGDRRGTMSAGLLVMLPRSIAGYGDWQLDLRVDESDAPLVELRRILNAVRAGQVGNVNAYLQVGDYEGALNVIAQALALDPGRDASYVQMAQVYLRMGDVPKAIEALATAIELNPKVFNQILRDSSFAAVHDHPDFLALGDISQFRPLPPSAPSPDGLQR